MTGIEMSLEFDVLYGQINNYGFGVTSKELQIHQMTESRYCQDQEK